MIAIIPARGGSKGLPGKNLKMLNGKPLIAYTIEVALKAEKIEEVFVTTDSEEIAEVCKKYGAKVPFIRPKELATDDASAVDVYIHAINYIKDNYTIFTDKFMVLLPTAPLRNEKHIDEAIEMFEKKKADTLISVCEASIPPSWYLQKDEKNLLRNAQLTKENSIQNRQKSAKYYLPNGAIYILDYELLKNDRTYYTSETISYEMPQEESIDIDTKLEFKLIEFLMEKKDS